MSLFAGTLSMRRPVVCAFAVLAVLGIGWGLLPGAAQAQEAQAATFEEIARPFLKKNCERCHNGGMALSGVRVDNLDGAFADKHLRLWEVMAEKIGDGSMPPKGQPRPDEAERQRMVEWIGRAVEAARLRPAPKNGVVRRLTVAQYRNTLRELLLLDDDLTEALPPDAVSADGFVNNTETLQLSPILLESYLSIADEALRRAIVDPKAKPSIQRFRMELGESINPQPFPEQLVLGANSLLLDNKDFIVTEPAPVKPFAFDHYKMRTKYRFIEGYQGNDTVRGWREYDSIYHSVFACMRGSRGYPKGSAYGTVPEGLLLRPAIPNAEEFDSDGTYGPKANFKISLRELPDNGRFRVTVTAAKYDDGLLLDAGAAAAAAGAGVTARATEKGQTVQIVAPGIYQVDVYAAARRTTPLAPDATKLESGLAGAWTFEGDSSLRLEKDAKVADTPFGKGLSLDGDGDSAVAERTEELNVGTGDFTVAAWVHPKELRRAGIVARGTNGSAQGWYLGMPDNRGVLRLETSSGSVSSGLGVMRANAWQHVAAVVRRGTKDTRLYVNGYPVARGEVGGADLDNPKIDLHIGRIVGGQQFKGELDEVRLYKRALGEAEVAALVQPGLPFAKVPPAGRPQDVTLTLGRRQFTGALAQPAFLAVRLGAGPLTVRADHAGVAELERVVLTPVAAGSALGKRFAVFEKRLPRIGVHVGLRRDCGSSLAPVGEPQTVAGGKLAQYVFEGAIRNFPSPDVEEDNVNYLAGVREIGVRSEYTDGRDMPRVLIRAVEFEGPYYEAWPPASHKNIFFDSAKQGDPAAYAREVIGRFASKAYRRPATAAEEATLMAVFAKSFAGSGDLRGAVKDALQVALTSPQFLFLTETSRGPEPEPLDDYELASKLSYFLWNGPPDAATLRLAKAGTLRTRMDAEVARMIGDGRFSRFLQEFTPQWLALDKFAVLEPDKKRYPKLTRNVRPHLQREPVEFVRHMMLKNLPVRTLIDSDFVMANEAVATYYGLETQPETGFQYVPVAHGRKDLGGVLTQPAILAGLSDGRESNPVKRGAWLARRIIAEPPPPPPPNVPALKEEESNLTLRQRLEQHRNQPGCQQCHAKIDPWGVPFEEFDAGGLRKRAEVDARSELPDKTEVAGVNDLKRYLAEDRIDQVAFSVLKHLATYATGRSLTYNELNSLKQDAVRLRPGGYRMQDMIRYVVHSKLFLEK